MNKIIIIGVIMFVGIMLSPTTIVQSEQYVVEYQEPVYKTVEHKEIIYEDMYKTVIRRDPIYENKYLSIEHNDPVYKTLYTYVFDDQIVEGVYKLEVQYGGGLYNITVYRYENMKKFVTYYDCLKTVTKIDEQQSVVGYKNWIEYQLYAEKCIGYDVWEESVFDKREVVGTNTWNETIVDRYEEKQKVERRDIKVECLMYEKIFNIV